MSTKDANTRDANTRDANTRELRLEVDKETARGRYANVAVIAHTRDEFILDFTLA